MENFDRVLYKNRAKEVYKQNIWMCIIATGIITLITSLFSNNGSGASGDVASDSAGKLTGAIGSIPLVGWLLALGIGLTIGVIGIIIFIIGLLVKAFVVNLLEVGLAKFFLEAKNGDYDLNNLLFAYKSGYAVHLVKVTLIQSLTIFVYSLLLVVPGIIKSYELRYVKYILAEDPSISYQEAFDLSKQYTNGHKMDLFVMDVSFILCYIINAVTMGLGQFVTQPYIEAAFTESYLDLSGNNVYTNDFSF